MQAIVTKYLGPTEHNSSRIKATCDAGSITVPYNHDLSGQEVHRFAALALCDKLCWTKANGFAELIGGDLPNQAGCVFVFNVKRNPK